MADPAERRAADPAERPRDDGDGPERRPPTPPRDDGDGRERRSPTPPPEDAMARAYARARERDAAVRAQLQPLAPGERPLPLIVAAALAALIAAGNLALLAAGWEVDGEEPSTPGVLLFGALMLGAAVGMWQRRYWAVLGFEALLGIGVLYAGLSLLVANNLVAIVLCVGVMVGGGILFWKLVRVMARIQVASRRPREPVG